MEHTVFISTFIGVRTEVVTLSLNQVRWQDRSTIAVVISNSGRECLLQAYVSFLFSFY